MSRWKKKTRLPNNHHHRLSGRFLFVVMGDETLYILFCYAKMVVMQKKTPVVIPYRGQVNQI
jgi:hypothetical protein